jgi:DNA-binding NtrC family response regulator
MKPAIAVIDDEPLILDSLAILFGNHFDVHPFSDPLEALQTIGNIANLNVIICDYRMPQMNGQQFFNAAFERLPDLSSFNIIYSGYSEHEEELVDNPNIDLFLDKSLPTRDIFQTIVNVANKKPN